MKSKTAAFVVCIFLIVALFIVYIFSELYTESDITNNTQNSITDADKFETEYESLNGKVTTTNKTIRTIQINSNNKIVYTTEDELVELIDQDETFLVYFGFAECPWCRSVIESFLSTSEEYGIDKIYYLDVSSIRDTYELDENHKAVRTKEGTEGYYKLLSRLSNILSDYKALTYTNEKGKTKTVKIDEKRIYAPNFVLVQDGEAVMLKTGICDEMTDAYLPLSDSILSYQKKEFSDLFGTYNKSLVTSTCGDTIC